MRNHYKPWFQPTYVTIGKRFNALMVIAVSEYPPIERMMWATGGLEAPIGALIERVRVLAGYGIDVQLDMLKREEAKTILGTMWKGMP